MRKLTKALGKKIVGRLATGTPLKYAALAEGVAENTVHEWMRRGLGQDDRGATPLMTWFATEVEEARAKAVQIAVHAVYEDPSWQAKAWWLERRLPDEFGRRDRMDHSGQVDHAVRVELAFDPSPIAANVRRRLEAGGVIDVEASEPEEEKP